jgi:hypothetical protein
VAVGYNKANTSPILKLFLSRIDDLTKYPARLAEEGGPESATVPR